MAYTYKQRSDRGFDFFKDNKKINIDEYVKATGQNKNNLVSMMAQRGDQTSINAIKPKFPTQISALSQPTVRTPLFNQQPIRPNQTKPKVQKPVQQNVLQDIYKNVGQFTAGANEQFLGGATRGAVNLANLIGSGLNRKEAERRTNEFLHSTGQINKQGYSPLTKGVNRDTNAFRLGQAVGQTQGIATDLATTILPGAVAEKVLRTSTLLPKVLSGTNLASRAGRVITPVIAGSLASSSASQLKNPLQVPTENFGGNLATDIALTALGPTVSSVSRLLKTPQSRQVLKQTVEEIPSAIKKATTGYSPGFVSLGRTPKNIHVEDQGIMSDFIDYARGTYKPNKTMAYNLEKDASTIAERYGIKMPPTIKGLANEFDKRLVLESQKPSLEAGFAKLPLSGKLQEFASRNVQPAKQKILASKPAEYLFGDKKAVQEAQKQAKLKQQSLVNQRGFTKSVQASPNITESVKKSVQGEYIPKTNDTLMGEAKALLTEGATIDFKNIKDLDKKVAATMQEAINAQQAGNHALAATLFNNLSEHGTELGRGVQAFSLLENMSPESVALSVAGKIKKFNQLNPTRKIPELGEEQMKIIADKMQAIDLLKPGRDKNIALNELNQTVNEFIPSTIVDKALTVWKAGLLTSLRTQARNFVGNTIHGIAEATKDIPGSLADIALSAKTGTRTLTPTLKGIGEFGSKSTRQQMTDIFQKGFDPTEQINKFDYKQVTWGKNPVEQGLKKYTDIVFRSLGASDKPFYNSAMARSLYSQAGAEAINVGKRGDRLFIDNLVNNPTESMIKNALSDANVATFKNENVVNNVVNNLKRGMDKNEVTKLIGGVTMPFTGVPSAILGQIVNYSPVGLLKGIYDSGRVLPGQVPELQRQASQEIGRGVIGSGIFGLGAYLAGKGLITGQPKDAEEAKQWELENKPRNSIFIGGKWRSLNSIGPESVVFLAGAKLNEETNNPDGSGSNYAIKLGKDFLDQSFVQGIQAPVNALTDPMRYGTAYAGQLLSSPIPNIVKDLAKATDSSQREANTALDYLQSSIPGLRQQMTIKRDVLGNVIPQEPTGLGAFVDLFNSKTPVNNPAVNELSRLNMVGQSATPSKLQKTQTINKQKVTLTPQELDVLEQYSGGLVSRGLNELVTSEAYINATDEEKKKSIDNLIEKTRKDAKNNLLGRGITPEIAPIPFSGGGSLSSTKLDPNSLSYSLINDADNISSVDKNDWRQQPVDTKYQPLIDSFNTSLPEGLPSLPATNEVAEIYSNLEKDIADNKWSDLQKRKEVAKALVSGYKSQLTDNEKFISTMSDNEIVNAYSNGEISNQEISNIDAVDNILMKLGMTPMIGKSARSKLGLSGVSSGKGGKTFKIPEDTTSKLISSTYADLLKLLSGTTIKPTTVKKVTLKKIKGA